MISRDGFLLHTSLPDSEVDVQSVSWVERAMQEDFVWATVEVHDMCEQKSAEERCIWGAMTSRRGGALLQGWWSKARRRSWSVTRRWKSVDELKSILTLVVVLLRKSLVWASAWMSCSPELRV